MLDEIAIRVIFHTWLPKLQFDDFRRWMHGQTTIDCGGVILYQLNDLLRFINGQKIID